MYSKLIVKRHAMPNSRYSPLSLERLEGNYCYILGAISNTMNKGSKVHLKPIDSLL